MRVGFLIDRWQPKRGGAERQLELFARHLEERGHEVRAFGARGPRAGEASAGTFERVRAGGLGRGARERALARALVAAARAASCDVTLGVRHLPEVDLLWCHGGAHLVTLRARWRARHAGWPAPDPFPVRGRHRTFLAFERQLLAGGARAVACPSELVRAELAATYPGCEPRLALEPNGVDLERFHPARRAASRAHLRGRLGLAERAALVVLAARDPLLKGLAQLFDALRLLAGEPWHLLVAGARRPAVWRRRAARAGLGARISFAHDVDAATLAAGADLCALPTWRDTSGLVLLEALAAGTPVVTTRLAGDSPRVRPEAGAVVADPADPGLAPALGEWIGRALGGGADPEAARACVADRGLARAHASLERLLARCAEDRPGNVPMGSRATR